MSYNARLEAHNDRIRTKVASECTILGDSRDFITDDNLWSIWMRPVGDIDSKTELDEFQECIPCPDLARNLYSTIKTISILICIQWRRWNEFAERFCRATETNSLDELSDLDGRLPFSREEVCTRLFPDDPTTATNFYLRQYVFLPIILEENHRFKFYEPEYRLPILDDHSQGSAGPGERIVAVRVAEGHFRFARTGELNPKPHNLRRKRITNISDVEREIQNLTLLKNTEDASHRIMRHVVAVKIGPEYNIFYGEAELDLEVLLNGNYAPFFTDSVMAPQALVGQACFLANALDFLHSRLVDRRNRVFCCHMDLKPANILIVRNKSLPVGKWMLSDFGITVVKVESQSGYLAADMYGDKPYTQPVVTKSTRYPSEYTPPEAERTSSPSIEAEDGRRGDIWAFGCILATLLLFCLGGTPLVKKLQAIKKSEGQTDYFYSPMTNTPRPIFRVKNQIKSWASQIGNHPGSWAIDWYQLIFDHMLLVSAAQRLQARQIQEHLELVWTQAPAENVWSELPSSLNSRPLSPTSTNGAEDRRPSLTSWLSSRRNSLTHSIAPAPSISPPPVTSPSGMSLASFRPDSRTTLMSSPTGMSSASFRPESRTTLISSPTGVSSGSFRPESRTTVSTARDVDTDPLMVVRDAQEVDFTALSPKISDSTESTTRSSVSAHGGPVEKFNLKGDLPDSDTFAICSDAARIVFWHSQNIHTYQRKSVFQNGQAPLFFRENNTFGDLSLKAQQPSQWIQATVAGSYMALVKSSPASLQVKVVDLDRGENAQPTTDWPSFQGLRSVCLSSQGSLALFYDKIVKFRCTKDNPNFKNSSWSTSPENLCAASFARDGRKFYAVSWNTLWIGTFDHNKWILKASGDHHLSARQYVSFSPYLVPFSTRIACIAHNPSEDKLRYLAPRITTKVDLGSGVVRVALSDGEEMMIYIRKLSKKGKFGSQSYYGLAWRPIGKTQTGGMTIGAESDVIDLEIVVDKNKKFALTSSLEQGSICAWVATTKGEIRKCRLT